MPLNNPTRLDVESLVISPSALSGNVNDYAPTGIAIARTMLLDGAGFTITGIAFIINGKILRIINTSTTLNLILSNENVSSSASNRFRLTNNTDVTILPGEACEIWYDAAVTRWRVVTDGTGGGGGGADLGMLIAATSRYIMQ